jgi:hypothetical protein
MKRNVRSADNEEVDALRSTEGFILMGKENCDA